MTLFNSRDGKFHGIQCPFLGSCTLGNCMFDHTPPRRLKRPASASAEITDKRARTAAVAESPAIPPDPLDALLADGLPDPLGDPLGGQLGDIDVLSAPSPLSITSTAPAAAAPSASQRPAQPPTAKPPKPAVKAKRPVLAPIIVRSPPATHPQRVQFVNVIYDKLMEKGYVEGAGQRAIDLEGELAQKATKYTYSMGVRTIVGNILSRTLDKPADTAKGPALMRTELAKLTIAPSELAKHHYVTKEPAPVQLLDDDARVNCTRCAAPFRVGSPATTTTPCTFHLLKRQWDPHTRQLGTTFPCCHEVVHQSSGCQSRGFHVFKVEDPAVLAGQQPFRRAPDHTLPAVGMPQLDAATLGRPEESASLGLYAAGVDCEMAWTTKGFELIRVTLVDFESRRKVYDRLVWPEGDILDLNTRFSGVSDMAAGILDERGELALPVDFDTMYSQLFALVTSRTILVGHGLENDLNVLRLIHDRIVDTAILYPPNKTRTHALRELAWVFLGRTIQTGEHDSMEDALAAIDIVRENIRQRTRSTHVPSF